MSHKTLYIDIDEEITSIVDRVRKAQADEVIVVVPKRALLIQSLVNLKLLKKEANRRKKRLIIVTQDRIGKKLIGKAGILVQGKMDEATAPEGSDDEKTERENTTIKEELIEDNEEDKVGSSDYFDEPLPVPQKSPETGENIGKISFEKKEEKNISEKGPGSQKRLGKMAKTRIGKGQKEKMMRMSDIVMSPKLKKEKKTKAGELVPGAPAKKEISFSENHFQFREAERQKNIKPEKFFMASPSFTAKSSSRKEQRALKVTRVKGRSGKYFIVFLVTFFALGAFAGAYYFLPRATVVLHLKSQEKSVSESIEASKDINSVGEGKVPAALYEITKEKSGEFQATGSKSLPGRQAGGTGKATGIVVIYNEFSSENQPLVVTTRLETSDGKIFRITKNIIVPGMSKIGGETKPGAIEVDVIADKLGEEYNIEPATFKITGFKGGPKYEKFYAKSSKAMEGGSKGEGITVTSQDIAQAKDSLVADVKKEALGEIKNKLGPEKIFFEDAVKFELQNSSSSVSVGSQAEKFTENVSLKARVVDFSEEDVKKLISEAEKSQDSSSLRIDFRKELNYVLAESDFEKGFVKFEVKTDVSVAGGIDLDNFKRGALGKNREELENLVKNYPAVKSADLNFWPFFVSRVPMNEKRIKIEVQ